MKYLIEHRLLIAHALVIVNLILAYLACEIWVLYKKLPKI